MCGRAYAILVSCHLLFHAATGLDLPNLSTILLGANLLLGLPGPSGQWSLGSLAGWSNGTTVRSNPEAANEIGGSREARVLNFFPVPVEEECLSEDGRRRGICMNTYECRIQRGKSHGPCALGFGVCCIFTTGCDEEVHNNLTYVISPGFPNLIERPMNCTVRIRKIDRQVSQLRIDFEHFNIGQPNRSTGVCDDDLMEIRSGNYSQRLCGWNSGQHVYVNVEEGDEPVSLDFRLPSGMQSRMWEMRVVQLGFEQRAPAGCLQYFRSANGTLRTLNYLPNGRYLANNDYLICVRQERDMCGISYSPCTSNSFRIGPARFAPFAGNNGTGAASSAIPTQPQQSDVIEGSGAGPEPEVNVVQMPQGVERPIRNCGDRVLIPCDFEEFITPGNAGAAVCNLERCGSSLCSRNELDPNGECRVETWATPFRVRIAFGPGRDIGSSADENVGMCLTYEQLPCVP